MATGNTVFEQAMADYASWDGKGQAPAFPLYNGEAVALVDRFPKFLGQVVIFPRRGFSGDDVSMFDLPTPISQAVDLVTHTIGRHMSKLFEGVRIIRHDEGYAVPNHPHTVLFPAGRGEGARLYEPSQFHPDEGYFDSMRELLALSERQTSLLDEKLGELLLSSGLHDPT